MGAIEPVRELPRSTKRFALIIGVDQYADTQINTLGGASNDAKALAQALERYAGFPGDQVILLASDQPVERQPTRGNILRRLSNLAAIVPQDGLLLISFAGHGIERGGQAFLLPADAQVSNDVDLLEQTAINVTQIKERIRKIGVKQVIMVLDACRNDPAGRGNADNPLTPAYTRGFNFDLLNREVTAFATLYATAVGHRAYEYKEKRQGYFTWELVEGLKGGAANEKGEITLAGLVRHLQERVPRRVLIDLGPGKEQKPFAVVEGYRADDLVIAVAGPGASAQSTPPTAPFDAAAIELSYWDTIKTSRDPEDFQAYLEKYPDGRFADLARRRAAKPAAPAIASDPALIKQFILNGEGFLKSGNWVRAEAEFRKALQLDSGNASSHFNLAEALFGQQRWAEAEAEYRETVRLEPAHAQGHLYLGDVLFRQQRWAEAEVEYREAVRLAPNNAEAHAFLGDDLRKQGKWADAEAELRKALEINPTKTLYKQLLDQVLRKTKN